MLLLLFLYHRLSLFILFLSPLPTSPFLTTVCDCSSAENKGFLEFHDKDCDESNHPTPPISVEYEIFSTIPEVTRFPGHSCAMWVMSKTVYVDFLGWETVTQSRLPLEVSPAQCRRMRDTRQCSGKTMDVLGQNKWALESPPHIQGSWLRTTTASLVNCHLEEVSLEAECGNCTISSPIGDIPGGTNGSITHNLVTLVWEDSWKEKTKCQTHSLQTSAGLLYHTSNATTKRIRDTKRQVDYLFNTTIVGYCSTPANSSNLMAVSGMPNVLLRYTEMLTLNSTNSNRRTSDSPATDKLSSLFVRSDVNLVAHTQYTRDLAIEMANNIIKEVRTIQCQTRRLAHQNAAAAAQYNGWQAAGYLDLPVCSKLSAVGNSVAVLQCKPMNVTFTTEMTSCGPQPRYQNSTISIEGWELTRFSECYWPSNFVNFNGHAHTYRNFTWRPVVSSILVQGHELIRTVPFEADNSIGTILRLHPAIRANPMSPAAAIAEILASVQEHHAVNLSNDQHVSSVLLHHNDAPHISFLTRVGNWMRNFGILSGVGITLALAIRFCGIGTILVKTVPCLSFLQACSPYSWIANSNTPAANTPAPTPGAVNEPNRETVVNIQPAPVPSNPSCIVNFQPPAAPAVVPAPVAVPVPKTLPVSGPTRLSRIAIERSLHNHREAARLLR